MSMQDKEQFLRHWNTFMERLKGRIRRETRKNAVVLNNILAELRLAWALDDDELGRWVIAYTRSHPDQGALVRKILLEMQFTTIPESHQSPQGIPSASFLSAQTLTSKVTDPSNPLSFILPLAGAATGFAISHFITKSSPLIQVVSTIAPSVLIYAAESGFGRSMAQQDEEGLIQACEERLERYKQSVISILTDE